MAAKFVSVDHDTPLLMPPDLRDWAPEGHLVHFIMDAVRLLDVGLARVNERGTGSPQYPPTLMLGLLIYSHATGTFSGRQIERATYENVAVHLLCADRHPGGRERRGDARRQRYHSAAAVAEAEPPRGDAAGPKIYAATERQPHGRAVQELEKREEPPPPGPGASPKEKMKNRLQTKASRGSQD